MAAMFTIGELARRTGLTTRTIRFYSDEGLLPVADRTRSGYRLYDAASLARLELLRTLRELGLGLPEAAAALAGRSSVSELARRHVELLDEQMRVLRLRRAVLRAVARNGTELDGVALMKNLATMTDAERGRLIDEFWDEVTGGLAIDPEFDAGMRSARPSLPDDPSPEQLSAWLELAELVRDKDFRRRIRQMSEAHAAARDAGEPMAAPDSDAQQRWFDWTRKAREAMEAGHSPDSEQGRALADEVALAAAPSRQQADDPSFRIRLAEQFDAGTDRGAERYWQLLATINGWAPVPSQVPAAEWIMAALRYSAG